MGRAKINLPEGQLRNLYLKRNFSTFKIAKLFGCNPITIANRLREYGIKLRDKAHMRNFYKKQPFSGSALERAYLVGFRLGDLNVYKPFKNSIILVARCHTTIQEQARLIKSLFCKYGGVKIAHSQNGFTINCFLDTSFDFLLTKSLPHDIFAKQSSAISFTAGYTDAEGSFGLNQGRGRFQIASYDYQILKNINQFLEKNGIKTKFKLIAKKGSSRENDGRWNNNLWRLNVNEAASLEKFIKRLLPYMKHKKRISDALIVLKNIDKRRIDGTIK